MVTSCLTAAVNGFVDPAPDLQHNVLPCPPLTSKLHHPAAPIMLEDLSAPLSDLSMRAALSSQARLACI